MDKTPLLAGKAPYIFYVKRPVSNCEILKGADLGKAQRPRDPDLHG